MKHCIYANGPANAITCSSPRIVQSGTTTIETCFSRCPFREQPKRGFFAATSQLSKSKAAKPSEKKKCGSCRKQSKPFKPPLTYRGNGDWTVAVTTAPRTGCTLQKCLDSVVNAGWPEPVVFAEPGSTPTPFQTVQNSEKKGVWHNWLHSIRWCLKNTESEFILTVQDDSLFHPQSREYAESVLWPSDRCGFLSLYTPKHYSVRSDGTERSKGVHSVTTSSLWGACALVWHRSVLEQFVQHKTARSWLGVKPRKVRHRQSVMAKRRADPSLIANSDTAIGKVLNSMGLKMWFVDPSPVSHIAVHSTIGHGGNRGRRNCYRCADHFKSLFEQVPLPETAQRFSMSGPKPTGESDYDEACERWHRLGYRLSMSIPLNLWQSIRDVVKPEHHTLEFGCGVSTSAFSAAKHTAVESSVSQAKRFRSAVYSPLHAGWYRWEPERQFDVILVDGPHQGDRINGLETIAKACHENTVIFIDDANREDGTRLASALHDKLGFVAEYFGRYATLKPPGPS